LDWIESDKDCFAVGSASFLINQNQADYPSSSLRSNKIKRHFVDFGVDTNATLLYSLREIAKGASDEFIS
jgi:hypothetical protein